MLWLFVIEWYCVLVGIASPSEMVKLAVLRLGKDLHTWCQQLNICGVDYSLRYLGWQDSENESADTFITDVDHELKLHCKLYQLKQQGSIVQYVREFRKVTLELGD